MILRHLLDSFGRLFDIGGTATPLKPTDPADAMRDDWEHVDADLRRAMLREGDLDDDEIDDSIYSRSDGDLDE